MILAATLLWAVEVIVVKRLVVELEPRTLAAARMGARHRRPRGWIVVSGRARRAPRPRRGRVGVGASDGVAARRLRRDLVRRARPRAGGRRHGGPRLRRRRDRRARGRLRRSPGRHGRRGADHGGRRRSPPPQRFAAGRISSRHDPGAPALRALRLPTELPRLLRRRRDPHAARVRRRGRVGRGPCRAGADLRGRLAVPHVDRGGEHDRRSSRSPGRRGLLGGQRTPRLRPVAGPRARTSRIASEAASDGPGITSSTLSRPAQSPTTRSTSSPSTPGSGSCGRASSTSRSVSSTSAGRRPPSSRR